MQSCSATARLSHQLKIESERGGAGDSRQPRAHQSLPIQSVPDLGMLDAARTCEKIFLQTYCLGHEGREARHEKHIFCSAVARGSGTCLVTN